jgi:tetratricopeptide (TPR) repeat protein
MVNILGMDLDVIIAFLTGSVGTLIIKEAFNFINRKIDFNRELEKQKFIRKLDRAEEAMSVYFTYLTNLVEIKKSFELVIKSTHEDSELDVSIIQNILNQNSSNLTSLIKDHFPKANAVHLYFDLEDEDNWSENDYLELLESLADVKDKDEEIQYWLNLYNSYLEKGEKERAENYWKEVEKVTIIYSESLKKLVTILEKNKVAIYSIIRELKKQL